MPKRSNNASSSRKNGAIGPRKRVKKEEPEKPEEPKDNSNNAPGTSDNVQNKPPLGVRDPNYYFVDGSVTLRVRRVLFKVHGSLLQAHSTEFCNTFNLCPQSDDSVTGGTCDEDAIVIPNVQPSEFRNLMRIVYCLPANSIALKCTTPEDKHTIVGNFHCCLDIAVLSRDFGMKDLEQWAKQELTRLAHASGKDLADWVNSFTAKFPTLKQDDLREKWNSGDNPPATAYCCFRFVEAIWYAKNVGEHLFHGTLGVMQYYCSRFKDVESPIAFLRIENLREVAPSLLGFLFLLLLRCGNSAWMGDKFTQAERLALFSAQSFLTPLPQSLKESLVTPLFKKPSSSVDFVGILSNDPAKGNHEGCPAEISSRWGKVFPASYYREINGDQFIVSIGALIALPLRRFDLIAQLQWIKCQACRLKFLELFDRDMQEVFARLAGYYKAES